LPYRAGISVLLLADIIKGDSFSEGKNPQ